MKKVITSLLSLVFIFISQSNSLAADSIEFNSTSKLGHLKSSSVLIYDDIYDRSSDYITSVNHINKVYYIKKEAIVNQDKYYLISVKASSTQGTIGWVKSSDMNVHLHRSIDRTQKRFYIKGSGNSYANVWGGSKDLVYNLSSFKNDLFTVNKTEKVGNNIWYRGLVNGETVWIHESYLIEAPDFHESTTSLVGHLRSESVIYETLGLPSTAIDSKEHLNKVYYIKKKAVLNGTTYYLISEAASSTRGTIGWVKSDEINTRSHRGLDRKDKTFYAKGNGNTYEHVWGGSKDLVHNLNDYENELFRVNKTEKVGNNIWYRGRLDGKLVWIHESYLTNASESNTSLLGHLRSNSIIYQTLGLSSSAIGSEGYLNKVYYIKKKAVINRSTYYLISEAASSTRGTIGWVKSSEMNTHSHRGVDRKTKRFYIKGNGNAYSHAWGGSGDLVYNLRNYEKELFIVNKTEKVGNNVWYRGVLDGQTVWIHEGYLIELPNIQESDTSLVGHLRSGSTIYETLGLLSSKIETDDYFNKVYYIKKQAVMNDTTYYLISEAASSTRGTIGWVESSEMSTHSHKGIDKELKQFYIKGNGNAYAHVWGGSKDLVFNLSEFKNVPITINKTEKVGNNIWYRGDLSGKSVWIHESYLFFPTIEYQEINKIGHLKSNSNIYQQLGYPNSLVDNNQYLNAVYSIDIEATILGETYYLLKSFDKIDTIGWVKKEQLMSHAIEELDNYSKKFIISGRGSAYESPWGGKKDLVFNLSNYKNEVFAVARTVKVGSNYWYQGKIDNQNVWIHESFLSKPDIEEKNTSRVGHLKRGVPIYKELGNYKSVIDSSKYLNAVYYIKKEALMAGDTYYLISRKASATSGTVGWVNSTDMSTHSHVGVDREENNFLIKGNGKAYAHVWGGSVDLVFNLSSYKGQLFTTNKTEKVGSNTWYRGVLDGKTVWIHEAYLKTSNTTYTDYNLTFKEAVDIQMTRSPQTDKYRNNTGYIYSSNVNLTQSAIINGDGVRLRTAPTFENNIKTTVNTGTEVKIIEEVNGDEHKNSVKWYKIEHNNMELYVHTSLVNPNNYIATTNTRTNIREAASINSFIYKTVNVGHTYPVVNRGTNWIEISGVGDWRNAKRSDVEYEMNLNNTDDFQHLMLNSSVEVNANELNKLLTNKGILSGKAQSFIDGGKEHEVNEIYLISHALLETGHGTSDLAQGVEVGKNKQGNPVLANYSNRSDLTEIKTVYNMFGIAAYDDCALRCGAEKAYNEGWDTPDKAIIGGAKFIGEDYIHNKYQQNTIYKMRWNFIYAPKQYATDIGWARKQIETIKNLYEKIDNPVIKLNKPRFKNN